MTSTGPPGIRSLPTWDGTTRQYRIVDLTGRDGTDLVSGVEFFQFHDGMRDWSNLVAGTGDGIVLTGTDGYDVLYGSGGYDKLHGGRGEDYLYGFASDDVIDGGDGCDWIEGGGGNDRIEGGGDGDAVFYSGNTWEYDISWNAETRQYTIADRMQDRDGVDVVSGVSDFAFADGQRFWANLVPGEGDGVTRTGTAGDDSLIGSHGYDVLQGLDGHDELVGYMADDVLDGGEGNDLLRGGHGNDRLAGGGGEDVARYYGDSWEYDIGWDSAAGEYRVADRMVDRDGADTLDAVESAEFADGTFSFAQLVPGSGAAVTVVGTPESQPADAFMA